MTDLEKTLTEAIDLLNQIITDKEQVIFDYFKVNVPEGWILILPEKYHSVIGDSIERIKFTPYIEEDKCYVMDKSKFVFDFEDIQP